MMAPTHFFYTQLGLKCVIYCTFWIFNYFSVINSSNRAGHNSRFCTCCTNSSSQIGTSTNRESWLCCPSTVITLSFMFVNWKSLNKLNVKYVVILDNMWKIVLNFNSFNLVCCVCHISNEITQVIDDIFNIYPWISYYHIITLVHLVIGFSDHRILTM